MSPSDITRTMLSRMCLSLYSAGSVTPKVGPSGSSRSKSDFKLIARFWDVRRGQITIGGIDVSSIEPEHLMRCMSLCIPGCDPVQ